MDDAVANERDTRDFRGVVPGVETAHELGGR